MSELVRDLGEFALIDCLLAALPHNVRGSGRVHGAGDDCAWWPVSAPATIVMTSDALVEGNHFRLDWTDWRSLGHKMLAVNLSDLASMGCSPTTCVVSLALTGDETVSSLEEMYRGAGELAAIYDVVIAGGDIVRTVGPVVISVTAIGELLSNQAPMQRSMAKPGDKILVSGTLGASASGVELLSQSNINHASASQLIAAQLRPHPRVSLGRALRQSGVQCCMDISDGLAGDLPKILAASQVGARVELAQLPVLPALHALFPDRWLHLALQGGEDYELLFTVPPHLVDRITAVGREVGASISIIGEITADRSLRYFDANGDETTISAMSWDHFVQRTENV